MQRTALSCLAALSCLLAVSACSDNPTAAKLAPGKPALVVTPTETLDQQINKLLDLFPREMREHDEDRRSNGDLPDLHPKLAWFIIKLTYQAGLSRPALMTLAKRELVWLSDWVTRNAQKMNTPPNGESKTSAAARVVLYMSLYIYNGPSTPVPSYTPGADAVVGIVTPNAPATIVTPTLHAGVQLESGSVAENTIVVVTQNPNPYPQNCSGPLSTRLCQYPQFYTFEQFPHTRLLKSAKFSVCHINSGDIRRPLRGGDFHDRFRLAHTKPENPADYTPGGTIRDQFGESIEILPFTTEIFTNCAANVYASVHVPGGAFGFLAGVGKKLLGVVTPKTAYAIDQGGGGLSLFFSDFNDVDPDGRPDRAVQSLRVDPVCLGGCSVHPGDHVIVNFNVSNVGTATGGGVSGLIKLVALPPPAGHPDETTISGFSIGTLVPNETTARSIEVVIPTTAAPGDYTIAVIVGIDTFSEPEDGLANNRASVPITIITL